MAKAKQDPNARRKGESHLQWRSRIAAANQNERDRGEPLVTPEAEQRGDYRPEFVTHVETGTKVQTQINRGGTPVERWNAAGKLSQSQNDAIGVCVRLWGLLGLRTGLTANYGVVSGGSPSTERAVLAELQAKKDLARIQGHVPAGQWQVFENVVRWNHAAGQVGEVMGFASRSAATAAFVTVQNVAGVIAHKEKL